MNAIVKSLRLLLGKRPPPLQVGAVCLDPETNRVLLITSRGTGRWVIPNGWPMAGLSLAQAAAREAWEEAGVKGRASETELGRFSYNKVQDGGFAVPIDVVVFAMLVKSLGDEVPEAEARESEWCNSEEAAEAVDGPGLTTI